MALTRLHETGFEFQTVVEVDQYSVAYGTSAPTISTTAGTMRTGLAAMLFGSAAFPAGKAISPATTQISGNFHFRHNGVTGITARALVAFLTGTFEIMVGRIVTTTDLDLVVNGVVVDTIPFATAFPSVNTYYAVGVTAFADPTTGFVSVYVDGVQILSWTGNSGSTLTGFYAGGRTNAAGGWAASMYVDDFSVDDAVGESDVAPSSPRFPMLLVNAAGDLAAWTPSAGSNFENVDDVVNDGDATFNYVTAASIKDSLNVANTVAGTTVPAGYVVKAVTVGAIVRKSDAGFDSQVALGIRDGATNESLGSAQSLPTTYGYRRNRHTLTPLGAAWSEAAVDATQVVLESAGTFA